MAKQVKVEKVESLATQMAPLVRYELGKLPRNGLNEGTKHGTGGTAGTYKAICQALKSGPMDVAALKKVATDNGDPGFARYAIRNHWVLPVQAK